MIRRNVANAFQSLAEKLEQDRSKERLIDWLTPKQGADRVTYGHSDKQPKSRVTSNNS